MTRLNYHKCDICEDEEHDLMDYKQNWIIVSSPDPNYSFRGQYQFFDYKKNLEVCSYRCLEEIVNMMED